MRLVVLVALVLDAIMLAATEELFLPLRVGAVPIPVTILLAAVTTPWLVRSAAALCGPSAAAVPLVAWVSAVLVFGLGGPGGDILLPDDWRSLLLLSAGIFPGAVEVGRALARGLQAGEGLGR